MVLDLTSLLAVPGALLLGVALSPRRGGLRRRATATLALVLGAMATLIAMTHALCNLDDPETLVPAFVTTLTPIGLGALLFIALRAMGSRRRQPRSTTPLGLRRGGVALLTLGAWAALSLAPAYALGAFIDCPSLLLVGLASVALAAFEARARWTRWPAALARAGLAAGLLSVLPGLLIVATAAHDPTRVGPGLAMATLGLLYGGAVHLTARCVQAALVGPSEERDLALPVGYSVAALGWVLTAAFVVWELLRAG